MKKRIVCLLLTLAVAFSVCGSLTLSAAAADSGKCGDNLTWRLTDGTLTVSGTGDMYDYKAVAFPSPWFEKRESITAVIIENGVTSIGTEAFIDCRWLASVMIPDSVTSIGYNAFFACTGLKSITIPDGVTTIGECAFYFCGFTTVTIPRSVTLIDDNAFRGCAGLTELLVDKENKVYHSAGNCIIETATKTLIQGSNTSEIPTDGSVISIGGGAFYACSGLTSIAIPNAVTSIGDEAFYASGLTSVTIGNGVTSIGNRAFFFCSDLTELVVDKENKVYHSAGNCIIETATKTLIQGCNTSEIPTDGSVTSIAKEAFCDCAELTSIAIPDSVKSIGEGAFARCSGFTSVTIGNGVKTIGNSAFYGCSELETIYFTGTEEQWNAIEKGEGWDEDAGANTLIFNAEPSGIRYDGDCIYGIEPGTTVDELKKEDIVVKDAKNGIVGTGAKVVVDGKEYTVVIKGDIDGDGNINATDYLKVRLHILKRIQLEDSNLLAAHVSTKTEKPVSAADYTAIRLHILKKKLIVQSVDEPVETPKFDATLKNIRVVVDGKVHNFDVQVADGAWYISAEDAKTAFGGRFTEKYVALDAYARSADIRYIKDEVLTAAYINTWKPYETTKWGETEFNIFDDDTDFERAFYMDLVDESLRGRADKQITATEFRAMLTELIKEFAPSALADFDADVTNANVMLTRGEGITMTYYAAVCLGVDSYNVGFDSNIAYPNGWNEANAALFPNWNSGKTAFRWEGSDTDEYWNCDYDAAMFWAVGRRSIVSSTLMFTLDKKTGDMNIDAPFTVRDAVSVLMRLYDSIGVTSFDEVSAELLSTPSPILSEKHIKKANEAPEATAENHPRWTGFALDWNDSAFMTLSEENIYHIANWGFNSVRINFGYRNLFNTDGDTYLCSLANLQRLDSMIAAAIECGVHVDLCMTDQPGREAYDKDFSDWGEFDLYINPEQQEKAFWVWETLAARYKDIPNSSLTFSPLWESLNYDLTTGLGAPEYTPEDVGAFFAKLVDVIRAADEDRLITYELSGEDPTLDEPIINAVADKTNILGSYNFVDQPYVYYSTRVPEDGGNGDNNNHSYPVQAYPTYLYSTCRFIKQDEPIYLHGCLPAGTVINLYLKESAGSVFEILADDEVLYSEELPASAYPTGQRRSVYSLYAQSEKCVSVTLKKDAETVVLTASGNGVEWSGMDVILPEEYARDYWYFNSPYDYFLGLTDTYGMTIRHDGLITISPTQDGLGVGAPRDEEAGRNITINEDGTYTTDVPWTKSSADTMEGYISSYVPVGGDPIVRFESVYFAGVAWEDVAEYYSDALALMNGENMSWWSNDFIGIINKLHSIGGAEYVEYEEFAEFNAELLKLMQKYQNTERP